MVKILDGRLLATQVKDGIQRDVAMMRSQTNQTIHILNVLVGDDSNALKYAKAQQRAAEDVGIAYDLKTFPADISQDKLQTFIMGLHDDPSVNGIMVHRPLPAHINEQDVFNCIDCLKDIEGMNARNIGDVVLGTAALIPCTAAAVMEHLRAAGLTLRGKDIVVVGASKNVGRPLALLLLQEFATVTVCHIGTAEAGRLRHHVQQADIVIVAVGKPGLITGDMIRDGAVVIDVGMNSVDGRVKGDVDFDSVSAKASMITPVPGGVGPVTVMMLMRNAVKAFLLQKDQMIPSL